MASRDLFERLFDVFTDFLPIASWVLGEPLKLLGSSKELLPGLPTLLKEIVEAIATTRMGRAFVFLVQQVFVGLTLAVFKLGELLEELFRSLLRHAQEMGLKLDPLAGFLHAFHWALHAAEQAGAGDLVGVVTKVVRLIVTMVKYGLLGAIWFFLTVATVVAKATATAIWAALDSFGYEGAKATWAEQFEELLGDWAKAAYDGAGSVIEEALRYPAQMAAFAAGGFQAPADSASQAPDGAERAAHNLNQAVMGSIRWLDLLGDRGALALATAHDNSLALRVPENWRARLKDTIRQETQTQQWWQEWYTKNDGSYGAIQWAEWVDRSAKVAIRVVQGIYFVLATLRNVSAKALAKAASQAAPESKERLLGLSTLLEERAQEATGAAGKAETVADVASAVFVRAPIWGLELVHLCGIVLLSHRRVLELYRP